METERRGVDKRVELQLSCIGSGRARGPNGKIAPTDTKGERRDRSETEIKKASIFLSVCLLF